MSDGGVGRRKRKTVKIIDYYYILRVLSSKNTPYGIYSALIKNSTNLPILDALAQCAKNLVHNEALPLDNKLRKKILNNRSFFDRLSDPNLKTATKRKELLKSKHIALLQACLPSALDYYSSTVLPSIRAIESNGPSNTADQSRKKRGT